MPRNWSGCRGSSPTCRSRVQVDNPAIQAQFGCVALHEQAAKVIDLYEMVAEDKGVELRLSGNALRPRRQPDDPAPISNLVSNAVRHTPQGGRIDVRIGERAGHTEVRVSNDGPGIPPEYLPHLFERFYRRAGRQTGAPGRHRPGTGHRAIDHGLPRRPRRSGKRTAAEDPPAPAVPFDGRCLTPVSATGAPPQPVLAAENRRGTAPGRAPAGSRASAAGRAGAAVHRAAGRSLLAAPRTSRRRRQARPGGTTSRASSLGARAFPENFPGHVFTFHPPP